MVARPYLIRQHGPGLDHLIIPGRQLPMARPMTPPGKNPAAPLISVIVPTYNYGHLLPRALDSVLDQIADDIELIAIDDGSLDNTAEILAGYAARHPGLRPIHQANAGAAAARNRGIREACGRYALMLDADDELAPGALNHLRQAIAAQPDAGMFLGGQVSVFPNGSRRPTPATPVPASGAKQLIQRYLLEKRISISHGCSLFRRDLLIRRPYPENLRKGEDIPVFAYLLVSAPVVIVDQPLACIHKHSDSLRHRRDADEVAHARQMVDEVFASLPAECQPLRQRYAAQRYLSIFRAAQQAGDKPAAIGFYRKAMHENPWEALRWRYLRKRLRLMVG